MLHSLLCTNLTWPNLQDSSPIRDSERPRPAPSTFDVVRSRFTTAARGFSELFLLRKKRFIAVRSSKRRRTRPPTFNPVVNSVSLVEAHVLLPSKTELNSRSGIQIYDRLRGRICLLPVTCCCPPDRHFWTIFMHDNKPRWALAVNLLILMV